MDRDQTIRNILRVDHAGEYGAIRIYEAQRTVAKWRAPALVPFLDEALRDERRHQVAFEGLMRERDVTPCRTLSLWGIGGYLLGLVTSLLGRDAILVCTEAVEQTVHRHLNDQIAWLKDQDTGAFRVLLKIQAEELQHLEFARDGCNPEGRRGWLKTVRSVVAAATEMLIWLSTYGASFRLARGMKRQHR